MAKRRNGNVDLLAGLSTLPKAVGMMAKGTFYKETPQVKGRIARALAHETRGGKGKVAKRPSYKKDMKYGERETTKQERAKIVYALARNTKKGKGLISKRPAYRKHVR